MKIRFEAGSNTINFHNHHLFCKNGTLPVYPVSGVPLSVTFTDSFQSTKLSHYFQLSSLLRSLLAHNEYWHMECQSKWASVASIH